MKQEQSTKDLQKIVSQQTENSHPSSFYYHFKAIFNTGKLRKQPIKKQKTYKPTNQHETLLSATCQVLKKAICNSGRIVKCQSL